MVPLMGWLAGLALASTTQSGILRVSPAGNDALSGEDWGRAKKTIQAALTAAVSGDEVWVAAGRYLERIEIKDGVRLYGGFAGHETDRSQRNWIEHASILDGQQGGVVVLIRNAAGPGTRVDGMQITGGKAIHGGGIKTVASAPVIANNLVHGNETDGAGAGISIWDGQPATGSLMLYPEITGNVIAENRAVNDEGDGGGIAVVSSSPRITRNVILRNEATRNGGGICCWRSHAPFIANNFIQANSASVPYSLRTDYGASSTGGGGLFASATDLDGRPIDDAVSAPVIVNNVFVANGAAQGGGLCLVDSIRTDLGVAWVVNNTLVANHGSGIYWSHRTLVCENNLLAYNTAGFEQWPTLHTGFTNRFNCVYGNSVQGRRTDFVGLDDLTGTDGNLRADPILANARTGDVHLQPQSPCVDAGTPGDPPETWTDMDGQPRRIGGRIDIGADESNGAAWDATTPAFHVRPDGDDAANGRTWAAAKRTIQAAVAAAAQSGGEVRVATGTYRERLLLPAFVYLYGGFAGTESTLDERQVASNPTVLDGGGTPTVVLSANAGYLVSAIDGFFIQGGGVYTGGGLSITPTQGLGGGIYSRVTSLYIQNNVIRRNGLGNPFAAYYAQGGGVAGFLSHSILSHNLIAENEVLSADGSGAGVYLNRCVATLTDNTFRSNRSRSGAALRAIASSVRLAGNVIESNTFYNLQPLYLGATEGAVSFRFGTNSVVANNVFRANIASSGAGMYLDSCSGINVVNNLFDRNIAYDAPSMSGGYGGGIHCTVNSYATEDLVIAHNTLVGNTATHWILGEQGGAMALTLTLPRLVVANNIIAFNSSGVWGPPVQPAAPLLLNNCLMNSNKQDYIRINPGAHDAVADPRFAHRDQGDFHLLATSPCIDTAEVTYAPDADADGQPRPLDGDDDGVAIADRGAFEYLNPAADSDGDGMPDGWERDHGLDLIVNDSALDPDGDGMTHAEEFVAGTDPRLRESLLQISVPPSTAGAALKLRWPSVAGRTYTVAASSQLGPGAAWDVVTEELPGTGEPLEAEVPVVPGSPRYCRVQVRWP
ncbi:MAG TPA: right-handed parallel beta-helix repeat-containing protein [Verrucomicrobiota bacterium]|nr:right-handed parallel beta-helix repeat-containing protein [Verrucomicrobiota bacterium]